MNQTLALVRSNTFHVKDKEAFLAFCASWHLTPIPDPASGDAQPLDSEGTGSPAPYSFTGEGLSVLEALGVSGGTDRSNFLDELSKHLLDEEVVLIDEVGITPTARVRGASAVVNGRGEKGVFMVEDDFDGISRARLFAKMAANGMSAAEASSLAHQMEI